MTRIETLDKDISLLREAPVKDWQLHVLIPADMEIFVPSNLTINGRSCRLVGAALSATAPKP